MRQHAYDVRCERQIRGAQPAQNRMPTGHHLRDERPEFSGPCLTCECAAVVGGNGEGRSQYRALRYGLRCSIHSGLVNRASLRRSKSSRDCVVPLSADSSRIPMAAYGLVAKITIANTTSVTGATRKSVRLPPAVPHTIHPGERRQNEAVEPTKLRVCRIDQCQTDFEVPGV